MDWNAIISGAIGSSPVAGILLFWVWQERKERRWLQKRLLDTLDAQVEQGDVLRRALRKRRREEDDG